MIWEVDTVDSVDPNKKIMLIQIFTWDTRIEKDIFGDQRTTSRVTHVEIVPGATLTYKYTDQFKGAAFPAIITVPLTIIEGVAISLIAQWIYDKLKEYKKSRMKLVIDDEEVEIEPDAIENLLTYRMRQL